MNIKAFFEEQLQQEKEPINEAKKAILNNTFLSLGNQNNLDNSGLEYFENLMNIDSNITLSTWASNLLNKLIPYLNALQASLYRVGETDKLIFVEGFALVQQEPNRKEYTIGEGKIGQAAEIKEAMFLNNQSQTMINLSATLKAKIECNAIIPLVFNKKTVGVLDLGFAQEPPQNHKDLLQNLSTSMAINLFTLGKEEEIKILKQKLQEKLANTDIEESKSSKQTLERKNTDIATNLDYAKRIQTALLTDVDKMEKYIPESFVFSASKEAISGDFHWFSTLPDTSVNAMMEDVSNTTLVQSEDVKKTFIAAIDCTGHGVSGALMSMAGSVFLNQIVHAQGIYEVDEILTQLHYHINHSLRQYETDNRDGMDISLCVIDKEENTLSFAGAKHPLVYIENGELKEVRGDKRSIGGIGQNKGFVRTFHKHEIELDVENPKTFYLFSDGYEDQFGGEKGTKFMKNNFRDLLLEISSKTMEEQKTTLQTTLEDWINNGKKVQKQLDDILVLGFKA